MWVQRIERRVHKMITMKNLKRIITMILKNTKRGWPPKLKENLKKSLERNTERLMTITRYNLPKCNRCSYWGWCDTIPQECPKGVVNGKDKVHKDMA